MVHRRQNDKKALMMRFHHHRSRLCCNNWCLRRHRHAILLVSLIIILGMYQFVLLHTSHNIVQLKMNSSIGGWNLHYDDLPQLNPQTTTSTTTTTNTASTKTTKPTTTLQKPIVIAYAISVTSCRYNDISSRVSVLDGAAILGHSIHLSSIRGTSSGSNYGDGGTSSNITRSRSDYDYKLYAFVHTESVDEECQDTLSQLGYTVIVKDSIPFNISQIQDDTLRELINSKKSCCGSKEYMKLYSYTLLEHPIVVHLDIDTIVLQPLDKVFDAMLNTMDRSRLRTRNNTVIELDPKHIQGRGTQYKGTTNIDDEEDKNDDYDYDHVFYFTRDYYQQTKHAVKDPLKYGIQGGFFIITPSVKILNVLTSHIVNETYTTKHGWTQKGYNGFWGDTQIQGFLSYAYSYYNTDGYFIINHGRNNGINIGGGEGNRSNFDDYAAATTSGIRNSMHSTDDDDNAVHVRAVELNRCIYNSMINDDPYYFDNKKRAKKMKMDPTKNRKCRTEEELCEDCRETPFETIKTIHYTTCRKPWECPYLKPPQPTLCKDAHHAWYKIRQQLEVSWGYQPPSIGNWHYERTLGYCNRMLNNSTSNNNNNVTATATTSTSNNGKRNNKQRQYIPIEFPFGSK